MEKRSREEDDEPVDRSGNDLCQAAMKRLQSAEYRNKLKEEEAAQRAARSFAVVDDEPTRVLTFTVTAEPFDGYVPPSASKPDLQRMCRERGLDATGTRKVMLERLKTRSKFFVTFEIDAREPLQRFVAVVLSSWDYDDTHLFSLHKLPTDLEREERENKIQSLRARAPFSHWAARQLLGPIQDELGDVYKGPAFDCTGGHHGFAKEAGMLHTGRPLSDVNLEVGHKLRLSYDQGATNATVVVDAVSDDRASPPEQAFVGHATHARILATGGAKMPAQYPDHGDY